MNYRRLVGPCRTFESWWKPHGQWTTYPSPPGLLAESQASRRLPSSPNTRPSWLGLCARCSQVCVWGPWPLKPPLQEPLISTCNPCTSSLPAAAGPPSEIPAHQDRSSRDAVLACSSGWGCPLGQLDGVTFAVLETLSMGPKSPDKAWSMLLVAHWVPPAPALTSSTWDWEREAQNWARGPQPCPVSPQWGGLPSAPNKAFCPETCGGHPRGSASISSPGSISLAMRQNSADSS